MSMFSKLKQVKDLRDQAKKIQTVLKDVRMEGTGGWGKVKVGLNGNLEVEAVTVDPELLSESQKSKLQDAIKEAVNDAIKKTQKEMAEVMRKTGGLNIPGLS